MSYGTCGRVLHVDLSTQSHHVEEVPEAVYRQFLAGYGLGAWLMWRHFPPGTEPLHEDACFAICAGLLTGLRTPFSGRIQIVGKSPLTGTWADSNSGGSVAAQLRAAGYDAVVVRGRAARPSVLVIRDGEIAVEAAGDLWGMEIPATFAALKDRYGSAREVGVSVIGPAGERGARIASVMNDRYHAFGRQGFGAIYGSKNLKAIVVGGNAELALARPREFRAVCKRITEEYKRDLGPIGKFFVAMGKPRRWLGWMYRLFTRLGAKFVTPTASMRRMWSRRGTTAALAISVENGDAPIKNWRGVATRDFPLSRSMRLDGAEVDKLITKKLSCGDCPMPCKGIVRHPERGLADVRRPDFETLAGFGANLLNDDLGIVVACHDACNRLGVDAVSASATLGWVAECVEKGVLTPADLDGHDMRWGNGEAALALTEAMGNVRGAGSWLAHGVRSAAEHIGRGSDEFAVHVHGQEPAYHDSRFTSLMGVTYIADPSPGRHTAGSASWNETFAAGFSLPGAVAPKEVSVSWRGTDGKGVAQAHYSNAHQTMNGLGLCMFTMLTGRLPWAELVNAATGWDLDDAELLRCGERIQNLRAAFNRREGIAPAAMQPHARMLGEGEGALTTGPLKGRRVPLPMLKDDYYRAMHWDSVSGHLSKARATELGIAQLLDGYLS